MLCYLTLFLPFLAFINLSLFGHLFGQQGCLLFSKFFILIFMFIAYLNLFFYLLYYKTFFLNLGYWFKIGNLSVSWLFSFDSLSLFMIFLISNISGFVIFYSLNYMKSDPFIIQFISYLFLFTFFMLILVTSNNLVLLLLGWEGVGICSFLLIGFWNSRISACKSSLKAIIFNRIGDMGFLVAISLIFFYVGSLDFYIIYLFLPYFSNFFLNFLTINLLDFIFLFLFFGVMGKSAQIGLHVWLLDAMEGPTPVSALIHAATMVTAGIFLLLRFSFILEFIFYLKIFIAIIGILTTFFFAFIGLFQNDLKSIIAYSTCSQLGYMVALCGVSGYSISFFHLINHGFFKALLFLTAGMIIHNFMEEQDIRKYGGLYYIFPLSYSFMFIGSLSLAGLPFLSGFYSKDFLLEFLSVLPLTWCNFLYQLGVLAAFFTISYSFRLLYYVFLVQPSNFKYNYKSSYESYDKPTLIILSFLSLFSIFSGFIFKDIFIGYGSNFFFDTLFTFSKELKFYSFLEFYFLQNSSLWFSFKLIPSYLFLFYFFLSFHVYCFIIMWENYCISIIRSRKIYVYFYHFSYLGLFFNYIYIHFFLSFFFKFCWYFFLLEKSFFTRYFLNLINFNVFQLSHIFYKLHKPKSLFSFLFSLIFFFEFLLIFFYYVLI